MGTRGPSYCTGGFLPRGGGGDSGLPVWGWGLGSAGLWERSAGAQALESGDGGDSECGPSPLRPPPDQALCPKLCSLYLPQSPPPGSSGSRPPLCPGAPPPPRWAQRPGFSAAFSPSRQWPPRATLRSGRTCRCQQQGQWLRWSIGWVQTLGLWKPGLARQDSWGGGRATSGLGALQGAKAGQASVGWSGVGGVQGALPQWTPALLSPPLTPPLAPGSDLLWAGAEEISRLADQCLCHCSQAGPPAHPGSPAECTRGSILEVKCSVLPPWRPQTAAFSKDSDARSLELTCLLQSMGLALSVIKSVKLALIILLLCWRTSSDTASPPSSKHPPPTNPHNAQPFTHRIHSHSFDLTFQPVQFGPTFLTSLGSLRCPGLL